MGVMSDLERLMDIGRKVVTGEMDKEDEIPERPSPRHPHEPDYVDAEVVETKVFNPKFTFGCYCGHVLTCYKFSQLEGWLREHASKGCSNAQAFLKTT